MSLRLGILVAVVLAFLSLAGAMLWYRGEAIAAEADRARAIADLNTAVDANKAQEETIGRLRASAEANDRIIAEMAEQIADIGQAVTETNQAVGDLKDANEDVRAYLASPVPPDLKRLLDR
ncbi:hypothetical protein [Allomesorhizobium camelthorni]|uniref:Uncharacterized protein n=1 Tax=Allomesorhizobium camelthorni TaxID=475069 RepID=A0A6G4W6N1_9HYPH|nr:hypothetical protein [Mesorhizobium camelthorni]NGO50411.1 hypothetical protein [Mesorhizobium camelthorni]